MRLSFLHRWFSMGRAAPAAGPAASAATPGVRRSPDQWGGHGARSLGLGLACALLGASPAGADTGHARAPLGSAQAQRAATASVASVEEARVIVKYRAGAALLQASPRQPQHAQAIGRRLSLSLSDGRVLGQRTQVLRGRGLASAALVSRLAAQPDVEWAVVDRRRGIASTPNDPLFANGQSSATPAVGQWFLRAPAGEMVSSTNALAAWGVSTGQPSVVVAVLDTGVRLGHPDLVGKLVPGHDFVSRSDTAQDGDGRDADASDPGDFSRTSDSCGAADSSWHGTQVAGLVAAATNNSLGVAGIGRDVRVLPVRVLGRCGGFDSDIIAGMRWAAGLSADPVANANPARIVNMSLGSSGSCSNAYRDAINELNAANVAVVVAAGNDAGLAVNEPANCAGAIAVAGLRHAGTKVGYSNIGPQIALAAPAGNCILVRSGWPCLYPLVTTTNSGTTTPGADSYSSASDPSLGTSFATPLVAGAAALMLSANPSLNPAQLKALLQSSARPFPTLGGTDEAVAACSAPTAAEQLECYCTTSTCGAGMLDAAAAVAAAAGVRVAPAAAIGVSSNQPVSGGTLRLDGSSSGVSATSFQWRLVSGGGAFTSSTNAASTSVQLAGSGPWTVGLTVTDATGLSSSTERTVGVAGPVASIAAPSGNATVGTLLQVNGSASAAAGRQVLAYAWEVVDGGAVASISGSALGSSVQVNPLATGTVTLRLTAADSQGDTGSATVALNVVAAPVVVTPPPSSGSGNSGGSTSSGGGGALGGGWLLGLALAVLALGRAARRTGA